MKKVLAASLAVGLLPLQLFAPWAAHLVISPSATTPAPGAETDDRFTAEAARLARGVSVSTGAKVNVTITLEEPADQVESNKRYYLVVGKRRLAPNALDLRGALQSWKNAKAKRSFAIYDKDAVARVAEVRPLLLSRKNGKNVIEFVLDREKALRSYVVWDFKDVYESGAAIMDGGLWLTYDIPAFVEARQKAQAVKPR